MEAIISTAKNPTPELLAQTKRIALEESMTFIERPRGGIEVLKTLAGQKPLFIVEADRLVLKGEAYDFFWHPSTAKIATGEIEKLSQTALIQALGIHPKSRILDCTLGLASDALRIAMYLADSGQVVGLESSDIIAFLTRAGLKNSTGKVLVIQEAAARIEVHHTDHLDYLMKAPSESFDAVYMDPMFDTAGLETHAINAFRAHANHEGLTEAVLNEAKRVSQGRVVVKERFGAPCFQRFKPDAYYGHQRFGKVVYGVYNK